MQSALTEDESDKMRTFLRTVVEYSKRGPVDMSEFIKAWRHNVNGYFKKYSRRRKREYADRVCLFCENTYTPKMGNQKYCTAYCCRSAYLITLSQKKAL